MSHTELRAIDNLALSDRLLLSEDVRPFRVLAIERESSTAQGRCKVHLRSIDGATRITLVRTGRELVRLVLDD